MDIMLVERSILRKLSEHITTISKPLPSTIKEALEETFPLSISQLERVIEIV